MRVAFDRFLALPLGVAAALLWANASAETYYRSSIALSFAVNDIAMALFFGLITQEVVEAIMPGGALHTWRRWSLPLVAAAGGIAGASTAYLAYVNRAYEPLLAQAWPVACAIDIAAAYYVLKAISPRSGGLPFLLLMSIVTDAAVLFVAAIRDAGSHARGNGVVLMLAAIAIAAGMRRAKVRSFWPYLAICGALSWTALFVDGVSPSFALVPIVPFLPHEPRRLDLFADPPPDDVVHRFEHRWNALVQVVMFFFGLVNGGVLLKAYATGTWATLVAALLGRPIGILVAVAVALMAGLELPRGLRWRNLVVVALATSTGFTFALVCATTLLPIGAVLDQIKFGALLTVAGALAAFGVARVLHVGRFA